MHGPQQKKRVLAKLLEKHRRQPIMVFVNQKADTETLQQYIKKELHVNAVALHGSKTQQLRELALDTFREGKADVLVCTNVAARGIDIDSVSLVINYDAPFTLTDYIHRIGRTGRAGKHGQAVTLL